MLTGEYAGTQGLGLLRLHSTFRHDLKIYASDEGRVQMTAAAFAKVCFFFSFLFIHKRKKIKFFWVVFKILTAFCTIILIYINIFLFIAYEIYFF